MQNSMDEEGMEGELEPCGHDSNTPVCMKCILSKATLQDSHLELLSEICESLSVSKKDKIRKDLLDLEENIGPLYDSSLGDVEALLSKVVTQHKDRKNVILDLGDELHKVVDLVINKYLSEAGKIEKEDLDFLQSLKTTFKMSASEIKAAIKEYREFLATDNNKKLSKYQSKNEQFRKMPTRYELKVTKFQPKHLTEEKLCQIIGVIPWSEKTELTPPVNGDSQSESPSKDDGSSRSPNAKKANGGNQSKADKLTELNDLMESISQATKDLVVALSPKVTRKLAVPKEFNTKATSHKEKVGKGSNVASEEKVGKGSNVASGGKIGKDHYVASEEKVGKGSNVASGEKVGKDHNVASEEKVGKGSNVASEEKVGKGSNVASEEKIGKGSNVASEDKVEKGSNVAFEEKVGKGSKVACEEKVGKGSDVESEEKDGKGSNVASEEKMGKGSNVASEEKIGKVSNVASEEKVGKGSNVAFEDKVGKGSNVAPEEKVGKRSNVASEVKCLIESKPKSTPIMNGDIESTSTTTQQLQSPPVTSRPRVHFDSEVKKGESSSPRAKSQITVAKSMEIDISIQSTKGPTKDIAALSTLQPIKEQNSLVDPKCRSSPLKEPSSPKEQSTVTTMHTLPMTFSSIVTAELSKEKKAVEHSSNATEEDSTKGNLETNIKNTDLMQSSPQKTTTEPIVELKECLENSIIDEDFLVEDFTKTSTILAPESEETNIFANAPWVVDTYETGYTYTYKLACARSTNQIFVCGNNKVIKQMTSEGKFVEKSSTESGNQPFDLALTSDAQLMYSDHNGKCVNIVRNNGKIENLIKLQKWFPMALCTTAANDLLVTMESEDLATCKVVRYAGSTVKQEIQFNVKGEQLYCRADFINENKNLDVVVSDLGARRIVVVDKYGIFRFNYTGNLQSNRYKSFGCSGVTTTSKCHIIVADEYNDVLHVIDQNGQFLTYIDNCHVQRPGGLCSDTEDALYVTEPVANRVKKIKLYR
uniref:Uncharacterized protein LOC111105628 n=1 Tax=Crassostrea virginica TaxID=6565 RepID=A0A8B8AWU2_CRAVI|nr:uncharacterized protein LOC111105628 [Crassostrea virginica]